MANSLDVWLVWWRKIVYVVLHIIWFSQAQLLCIFLNIFIHQFSALSNICWICCIINSGPVSLIFFTSLSFCESLLSMFSSVHVSACTFPMAVKRSLCPFLLCIPLLSLFSLFLKLNMISLSLQRLLDVLCLRSFLFPLKSVKLGTWSADPVMTGAELWQLSKPLHSCLHTLKKF